MYTNLCLLITIILLSNEVLGKNGSNAKTNKNIHKHPDKIKEKVINERGKRSLTESEKTFLTHGSHGLENENLDGLAKYTSDEVVSDVDQKNLEKELPFWGTRGRRDSSASTEHVNDKNKDAKCKICDKYFYDFHKNVIKEELDPFWFERGVKDKSRVEFDQFWDNRVTKDEMEPFWGNRGRRDEMEPFWGHLGRRDEVEPFWGNRGRRDKIETFWVNRDKDDVDEPFWGNRGRRDETEPFWGNRGRRQVTEPFWGTRVRRESKSPVTTYPYWGNQEGKKSALKESIIDAMDDIKYGIEKLSRIRRTESTSFWDNRGGHSKLENLFKAKNKNLFLSDPLTPNSYKQYSNKLAEQNTMLDERMYAEQPHYILIERSSRSSAEDDPFFISRGKKYANSKLVTGYRNRRGVLEELVKSVRTDPYYIARGKKDTDYIKIGNSTILKENFLKAKELVCSAIDLLVIKNDGYKVKRDTNESERERRTILKKLAAQLQMDPYFVSRGKKNGDTDVTEEHLEEFINHVSDMCI